MANSGVAVAAGFITSGLKLFYISLLCDCLIFIDPIILCFPRFELLLSAETLILLSVIILDFENELVFVSGFLKTLFELVSL